MDTVLRIVDRRVGDDHHVVVSLRSPETDWECEATVRLSIGESDAEKVRWYLEDYAEFPADPAPEVAREYDRLDREYQAFNRELDGLRALPAETTDGRRVNLYANVGLIADLPLPLGERAG